MITEAQANTRREEILSDQAKIQEAVTALDKQRVQLQNNFVALSGALQQVDFFLNANEETNEEVTEDE